MSKEAEPKLYEIDYLLDGRLTMEKAGELADKIRGILDTSRNMIMEVTPLKVQKLAYPVKRHAEAFWGWIRFMADPKDLKNIKTKIETMPEVIRILATQSKREEMTRVRAPIRKKKAITAEEAARTEEIDKKLEEILGT